MAERRYHTEKVEVRAGAKPEIRVMMGHAAVFNKRSKLIGGVFEEIIRPGAFAHVIQQREEVTCSFWQHDEKLLLATTLNGSLRLSEDDQGLYQETDLAGDTTDSRNVIAHLDAGRINSMSFAFRTKPKTDRWSIVDGVEVREVNEVNRLKDVSPVTFPAYEGTDLGIRYEGGSLIDFKKLAKLIVRAENSLDMTRTELDELKQFRFLLDKLVTDTPVRSDEEAIVPVSWADAKRRFKNLF